MKAYPMKARIRNEGSGPARVDIYDDIGAGGWLFGGISASDVAGQLQGLKGPLDVHISSSGGDVFDGLAIAEAIRSYPGQVTTVVDGIAASIASVIAQAGQRRVMAQGSMLMIHDAWGFPEEPNEAGLLKMAATLGKISDNLASVYAQRAGGTAQQWRQAMQAETWYTADEAVAAGLADEVGGQEAQLPRGLDVDALAAHAPVRIMARLRTMPRAAADDGDGGGDGGGSGPQECKTCGGSGRLKHPGTGKNGVKCPGCGGSGTYDPDAAPDDGGGAPGEGAQDRARADAGKPYEPQPYHRDPDENVECPQCHLFDDTDARFCDQCGTKLVGREDVRLVPAAPSSASAGSVRNAPQQLGEGWVQDPDGRIRFDPDGDGDDDSDPAQDTDHDYFAPDGTPVRPIPPCPVTQDSLFAERLWAVYRQAVRDADGKVDNSPWDASKAWAAGSASDDPAKFFAGICAGEKTTGEPDTQAHWALPYRYSPDDPPNAAAVRNCLARLDQTQDLKDPDGSRKKLQALMKQVNPDYEPEDSLRIDFSRVDLGQLGNALKEAIK